MPLYPPAGLTSPVANTDLATMPTNTIKGNNTAGVLTASAPMILLHSQVPG